MPQPLLNLYQRMHRPKALLYPLGVKSRGLMQPPRTALWEVQELLSCSIKPGKAKLWLASFKISLILFLYTIKHSEWLTWKRLFSSLNFKRLTIAWSLCARTLVFLSFVLSSSTLRIGLLVWGSSGGKWSLLDHQIIFSDISLISLEGFWRHCVKTQNTYCNCYF